MYNLKCTCGGSVTRQQSLPFSLLSLSLSISSRDQYLEAIESLPLANTPEVFGLHANAEINYFTRTTKDLWSQLVELQPQTADSGTGISRDEFISGIASDIEVCTCIIILYTW